MGIDTRSFPCRFDLQSVLPSHSSPKAQCQKSQGLLPEEEIRSVGEVDKASDPEEVYTWFRRACRNA